MLSDPELSGSQEVVGLFGVIASGRGPRGRAAAKMAAAAHSRLVAPLFVPMTLADLRLTCQEVAGVARGPCGSLAEVAEQLAKSGDGISLVQLVTGAHMVQQLTGCSNCIGPGPPCFVLGEGGAGP